VVNISLQILLPQMQQDATGELSRWRKLQVCSGHKEVLHSYQSTFNLYCWAPPTVMVWVPDYQCPVYDP